MTDVLSPEQRHLNMSRIRSRNTLPELTVRRLVHGLGYRYRLHDEGITGKPDIVFKSRNKLIFVHGCFWHSHSCSSGNVTPATNANFWKDKRQQTVARDLRNEQILKNQGWDTLTVWECELTDINALSSKLKTFLD